MRDTDVKKNYEPGSGDRTYGMGGMNETSPGILSDGGDLE